MNAPRRTRVDVNGWIVLDKPVGMTSTYAVGCLKRALNAKKAGHAGTLDPLASGILPVAFGEATKTVPFVQDGLKAYSFVVRWGVQTNTDDADGTAIAASDLRPAPAAIEALLPRFIGTVQQTPPAFSAIKINGERAYDLARDGEAVVMEPRLVTIRSLRLVQAGVDEAEFLAECSKGTYVRSVARDLGTTLGCLGHVVALRRLRVGPFVEADAVTLTSLTDAPETALNALLPVASGLSEVANVVVDRTAAARLRRGQSILLRGGDAPLDGAAYATCSGVPVALGTVAAGELLPSRVFNLPF